MKSILIAFSALLLPAFLLAQGDNEIQVYASPTVGQGWTIFELHTNYTPQGSKFLSNPDDARWTNETLEITYGTGKNTELGLYTFTAFSPSGHYEYLGNQIRPRITVPESWHWGVGASISAEFGFFRPDTHSGFIWQGEIRPIIDKNFNHWYFAFNPNIGFVVTGDEKGAKIEPQFKTVYTIRQKVGVGIEYYSDLGTFREIEPIRYEEHLLGPMIDLYVHQMWEINFGMLFGLTDNSNQRIIKILLGRRVGH